MTTPSKSDTSDQAKAAGEISLGPAPRPGDQNRHLIKAAGLMGAMTLLSRILGMIRDIVSAKSFGTSWQWDAFLYSFMLPNFFRRLVGEGALSSAFIPVYNEIHGQQGQKEAFRFANVCLTLLACALIVFLLLAEIALEVLLRTFEFPPVLNLTLELLKVMFPYLWFMSLFALGMGILNSHRHFFAPALGPVILDIAWIAGVLWIVPRLSSDFAAQVHWLAVVILISGALQLSVELPALYRLGFRLRWIWDWFYPGLRKTLHLFLPVILGFAVVQINLLVDSSLGLIIGPGANSSLWYGNRLMQFPLGIFAVAMGTALLPTISRQVAGKELEAAKETLSFALRSVFLIILPSAVGLMVLRTPIIELLFERGEFDAMSTSRTANVLLCYSIGLFAYSGQKIIAAGFYAAQDTKTPVRIGVMALIVNIVLNLVLMIPLREAGLALATSLAGILQFFVLTYSYHRKIAQLDVKEVVASFVKISAASLGMGLAAVLSYPSIGRLTQGAGTLGLLFTVFGTILTGALAYIFLCMLFGVREMKESLDWMVKRGPGQKERKGAPSAANGGLGEA